MKPYLAQIRSNLRLMYRDRAVVVFSVLFPLVLFFLFAQTSGGAKDPAAMLQVLTMVVVIGVLNNGFFGAGMRTVQDRETNVLRRFKVAPISSLPLLVSSIVAGVVSFLPTVILFFLLAVVIYKVPLPSNFLPLLVFVAIAIVAFRALGLIIAAVVNSAQEAQIMVQFLYLPMLFLSGATFPISIMPDWVQIVAGFLPATYLFSGMQSMLIGHEPLWKNWAAILSLLLATFVSVFIAAKVFRWEKEEKISPRSKAWIVVVLAPFLLLGLYQGKTKDNIREQKALMHQANRGRTILFTNVRIFVGNGMVIPNGAVLMRHGKIEQVFRTPPSNAKQLDADVWDESGRTLMPGLIDMHVHLGSPGGVYKTASKYMQSGMGEQRLAAYLYCGITAVRSTGDFLENSLKLRATMQTGENLGAELFTYGPLFTAAGGHPTELLRGMPAQFRSQAEKEFVRLPNTPQQARDQVDELKTQGVDGIKAVLEGGGGGFAPMPRLADDVYRAVIAEAIKKALPTATHTANSEDVKEAVAAGTNTIEHGSRTDLIPAATFAAMKERGIALDPTLSVYEAMTDLVAGKQDLLDRSLVQRVVPPDLLADTRGVVAQGRMDSYLKDPQRMNDFETRNLVAAYQAGVPLITGSDAGNLLVFHGPTVQHELALWVKAGVPAGAALQAATYTPAKYLHAEDRIGIIEKGRDATFLLLDGDPVMDITATERIAEIFFQGEQIQRYKLLQHD